MDLEDRRRLAEFVLGSLSETPVAAVRLLAAGLALSDGFVGRFATAFDYYADVLEFRGRHGRSRHGEDGF